MVTIQEAKRTLQRQRQALQQRQQKIREAVMKPPTVREIRARTPTSLAKERGKRIGFVESKKIELQRLEPFSKQLREQEKEVERIEQQIQAAERQRQAFQQAESLGKKTGGQFLSLLPKELRTKAESAAERRLISRQLKEKAEALKGTDITLQEFSLPPQTIGGITLQSKVEKLSLEQQKKLENVGLIKFDKTKEIPAEQVKGFTMLTKTEVATPTQIGKAPSQFKVYKSFIARRGPITGTLGYVGERVKGLITRKELQKDKPYQPYATGKLAQVGIQTAPYFSPLGPTLLVATGAEKLTFGLPQVKAQEQKLIAKGIPAPAAKTISLAVPVGEVGLGLLGIKGQMKIGRIERATPTTQFAGTVQKVEEGSKINLIAKTIRGPQEEFVLSQQLLKSAGKKGIVSVEKGYQVLGDISKAWDWNKGVLQAEPVIQDVKRFVSVQRGTELGKGFIAKQIPIGKIRASIGEGSLIGKTGIISRKTGDVYSYLGGEAKGLISKPEKTFTYIIKKPTIVGKLLKIPTPIKEAGVKFLQPSGIKKTPFSSTFAKQEQTAIQKAIAQIASTTGKVPKPSAITRAAPIGSLGGTLTSTTPTEKVELIETYAQTPKVAPSKVVVPKITGILRPEEQTTQIELLGTSVVPKQREEPRQIPTITQIQPSVPILRQPQSSKLISIESTILKQPQISELKTEQISKSRLKSRTITKLEPIPRPRRIIPPPPIPLPAGVEGTKTVKALRKFGNKGVNVVTGMMLGKQRIIARNLPPFKALKKAREYVDRNIEASFKLVPSGKKYRGKDIKPFNVGMKFRPSKRDPLFVVEKRKFRLDSPMEKRQIKIAKRRKII